jgi:hypothetical protein
MTTDIKDFFPFWPERSLHGICGISARFHAMPPLLANATFHANYLVE